MMSTQQTFRTGKRWRRFTVRKGAKKLSFKMCEVVGPGPGPTLSLVAGQHGMEPAGPMIVSMIAHDIDPRNVRGRIIMVPAAYANALRVCCECEPIAGREKAFARSGRWHNQCPYGLDRNTCGRNLNRLWPGCPEGSVYERLTAEIWNQAVRPADYLVDFHCWQDWSPPGALCYSKKSMEWAQYAGISWLDRRDAQEAVHKRRLNMLTPTAVLSGKTALTIELTPQVRVNGDMFTRRKKNVINLMRRAGVLQGRSRRTRPLYCFTESLEPTCLRAPRDVLVVPLVAPGDWVKRGERIATLVPIAAPDQPEFLKSPHSGIVLRVPATAAITRGQAIVIVRRAKVLNPK